MFNLKTYKIENNDLINDLNQKLLKLSNNNSFFKFNNTTQISTKGYHFENLDSIINNQIKDAIKLYTSNNILNHYYAFF